MRRRGILAWCVGVLLATAGQTSAQQSPPTTLVSRAQSQILLDMPGLANGRETYQYFGWDSSYAIETSYAAVVASGGEFPRAQIYMRQLGKGRLWTLSRLDENWIRSMGTFFRNVVIVLPDGPRSSTEYVTTLRFTVNGSSCVGFSLRPVSHDRGGSATGNGPVSFDGVYCAAPGPTSGPIDEQAVLRGVYFRRDGAVARAYEGDASPIPDRLRR
ncbi:MAG: hypothetical protein JNK67_09120 [Alphaproteobacteria bacterium]|nr:hypothetical protein [Alphaproteobacteria bacterium]